MRPRTRPPAAPGRLAAAVVAALAASCDAPTFEDDDSADPGPAPLGMTLADDGRTYAGVAVVDITPEIRETFTDLDGDGTFDGCLDDPAASGEGCDEPFGDADGDGWFDATFIGGFGPMRPAQGVHDPISARALVVSQGGEYVALVSLDLVGLLQARIEEARARLEADGFAGARLIVASSHNHQGPDVVGLWGNPTFGEDAVSGLDPEYNASLAGAIEEAVRQAAGSMEEVTVRMGAQPLRERDPAFNGRLFGGTNPTDKMIGLIHDIRDPVIASDQLFVLQLRGASGAAKATLVNWAGHPEVRGGGNGEISADYVGYLREYLEQRAGGTALFLPESLGGMQSALGGDVPLVDEAGQRVWATDDGGAPVPAWAERDSWEFCRSLGYLLGEAALDVLETRGVDADLDPLWADVETVHVHVDNLAYQLLAPLGLFDLDPALGVVDRDLCPEYDPEDPLDLGCIPERVWRVTMGPARFLTFPGELLPEIFWGTPVDDARWAVESEDPAARGSDRDSAFFPQHDRGCDAVDYEDCRHTDAVGDCDCLSMHDVPYAWAESPGSVDEDGTPPLVDLVPGDFAFAVSMTGDYLSYIVPDNDFNTWVSLLGEGGDHYEETVSGSRTFASKVQGAHVALWERDPAR